MALAPDRIAEDLRGQVTGDVLCDDVTRRLYASDASLYEIEPAVVVRPRVTSDVEATVQYAVREGIPIHPRGAGSGLAGGCLGSGIVVDFSRYMRRLLSVEEGVVRVQAGLVHSELNARLAKLGQVFGPDPAMSAVTTLGGCTAVDASGSRRLVYGAMSDNVVGMRVVLGDGRTLRTDALPGEDRVAAEVGGKLFGLLSSARETIHEHTPKGCVNTSGYALADSLKEDRVDLTRLLVGSEGTLGLITELTLRTTPLPACVGSALLTFPSLDHAAEAVQALAPLGLAACDLIDRRRLSLARQVDPRYEMLLSGAAEAVLYVERLAENDREVDSLLDEVVTVVRGEDSLAAEVLVAETQEDHELYRELAGQLVSALHGLKGKRRAVPGVEDFALPPAALPQFFRRFQQMLKRREVTASVYGHVGHGQLHVRPLLDLTSRADVRRLETLASDLYEIVWLLGGTISGEHGDGLCRTPFSSRQHGPLVNTFRGVKSLLDPMGILNPGKVTPLPGARMTHSLRATGLERMRAPSIEQPTAQPPSTVELQLRWSPQEIADSSRQCNGCGACRSTSDAVRMCPIFRYTPREEASPRAKANLVRGVLSGDLPEETLLLDGAKEVADLCVNCHQCRLECPAEVDIPKLMLEAKASYVATNGLRRDAWWAARLDTLAGLASRWPSLANLAIQNPVARWALERTTGLAAGRKLPAVASRTYLKQAASRRLNRPPEEGERIYYFVDTYANRFDTELANAFERVVRRHDVGFYAPTDQLPSGMAMISQGSLDSARRIAARNVARLSEAVRDGYAIVATEPSAVLAITHEYLHLLDADDDAQLVAANTFEACHYLWRRHGEARLKLDLNPLPYRVAHHTPCHMKALRVGSPAENLLRLIPELKLSRLEKGCSGMAGTYGLLRRNYRSSLRAGLPLLTALRRGEHQLGSTECGACRMQMEQNASTPTLHPIKLLAASYGLMPEVLERLEAATANLQESD